MIAGLALALVRAFGVVAEGVVVAVVVLVVRTLVKVLDVDAGNGDVGAQRQLRVSDRIFQKALKMLDFIVVDVASFIFFDVNQKMEAHVVVAGQVSRAAVKRVSLRRVSDLNRGQLRTVVNIGNVRAL